MKDTYVGPFLRDGEPPSLSSASRRASALSPSIQCFDTPDPAHDRHCSPCPKLCRICWYCVYVSLYGASFLRSYEAPKHQSNNERRRDERSDEVCHVASLGIYTLCI